MKKRITSLLAILLLVSLVACGNNTGDTEPTPSDAAQPPETIEPSIEPTTPTSTEPTTTPTQEPTTPPIEEPGEEVPTNEETTPEATQEPATQPPAISTPAPVNTPAPTDPPAPVATSTPTPTPAPVHTHSYTVSQSPTCTTNGIEICSCGETRSITALGHQMRDYGYPESGHMEQVQVGTNSVPVYETVMVYECKHCKATTTDYDENSRHIGPGGPCGGFGCMIRYQKQIVGTTEEPIYENQWVIDTPATIIHICDVCGYQE